MSETEEVQDGEARVIGVDSESAEDLIGALSSDTSREILAELHESPATPSEVADRTETTVQNARYHLENLSDAGLIEVNGTRYSPKGREMDIYEPSEPLVMFVGREEDSTTVRDALTRFLAFVGLAGVAAVFVEYLFRLYAPSGGAGGAGGAGSAEPYAADDGGGDMGAFDAEQQEEALESANETAAAADAAPTLADRITDLPPGLVFFVAATAVAVVALGAWYARKRRNG